jgi:hypothetical protein
LRELQAAQKYMKEVVSTLQSLADRGANLPTTSLSATTRSGIRDYAFACPALREREDQARNLLKEKVRPHAVDQVVNGIEARDRAYWNLILLMIARATGEGRERTWLMGVSHCLPARFMSGLSSILP